MNKEKNRFKITQETLWSFTIILVNIFVFFGYLIPQRSAFLVITAVISLFFYLALYKKINKEVIKNNLLWIIILLIFFIQISYTYSIQLSTKFIITFGSTIIMKIVYDSIEVYLPEFDWKSKFIKVALVCSGIHVVATLLYNFYPDLINNINKIILTNYQYNNNVLQHYWQRLNPGICDDYGFNAFCNLMFVGLIICKFLTTKKMGLITALCLIGGILAMIIIGKRSHLLCLIIGTIICFFISFNKTSIQKKFLVVVGVTIIGILIYQIALHVPATSILLTRLEQSQTTEGLLNGRENLYQYSIETFQEHPLIGIGIRGICAKYFGDGHNIYLQILAEMGIIGAFFVFIAFIYSLVKSIIIYLKTTDNLSKMNLLISIFIQIFFLINGITENPFYVESILILYLIIVSISNSFEKYDMPKNKIIGKTT